MQKRWINLSIFLFFILVLISFYYTGTDISLFKPKEKREESKPYNVWLISYASHGVHIQNQNNLILSSRLHPVFDIIIPYQTKHIDPIYYQKHINIFSKGRGAGYWLWKPYFIVKTLNMMPEEDVLVYIDSSAIFLENISSLLQKAEKYDITSFSNFHNNRGFIKRVIIDKMMNGDDSFLDKKQLDASFILIRNNPVTRRIMTEWLKYCEDEELLTDIPSNNEYKDFVAHRHDQSILSMLYYQNLENFYVYETSPYTMKAYELIRRRASTSSLLPLTFENIFGIWFPLKMKILDLKKYWIYSHLLE